MNKERNSQLISPKNIDLTLFLILSISIFFFAFFFSIANITHDSIDYYTILANVVLPNENNIVNNTFFVEQRAPGYSILSVPAYFGINAVNLFLQKEITIPESELIGSKAPEGFFPNKIIKISEILFKNILIENQNSVFDWKIFFALFITSILFLLMGIYFATKTLLFLKEKNSTPFIFLIGLIIIASPIFFQSIIQTPTYATLCAFGLISIFTYFLIKSFNKNDSKKAIIAGLILAILSFTRFEGIVIGLTIIILLFLFKVKELAKNMLKGFLVTIPLFLIYNYLMFQNAFSFAFLKGDLNKILFEPNFILTALFSPNAGLLFFSPLIIIGCIGLFFSDKKIYKILGITSIIFIISICLRVPVICTCIEREVILLGIEPIMCSIQSCTQLIQSDINRYSILLIPFALIGLQNILFKIKSKLKK